MIPKISNNSKPETEICVDDVERDKLPDDVIVIAQEVKIIKALAGNDLAQRTKQLKKLRRWLTLRANSSFPFTEEDFLRIWKGLYYMMWMSDKPLVQEELAEDFGKLIECFDDVKTGVQFFGAFLKTMCREWFGVDQWRMDKFLMLIRRMVRYIFRSLKKDNWIATSIKEFNTHILGTVLAESTSIGITMHFMDVFFEELAKVSEGELSAKTVGQFVKPFVRFMATQHDFKILGHCRNRVFHHMLYQSELGREYTEKYNVWKELGFPTESIDDLEKVEAASVVKGKEEADHHEPQPKPLDPRAGNVDVYIPLLALDGKYVVSEIESLLYKKETAPTSRKLLKDILEKYQKYQAGKFPLGVQTMPKPNLKSEKPLIKSKVKALEDMENDIYSTTRKLKQLNKRKRRKLLASLNFSEADEDTFEKLIEHSLPKSIQNGVKAMKRKSLCSMSWIEEDAETEVSPHKIKKIEVKMETAVSQTTPNKVKKKFEKAKKLDQCISEWDKPLEDGEVEIFFPSVKQQLKSANEKLSDLVPNPFAKTGTDSPRTKQKKNRKKAKKLATQRANVIKTPLGSPYTPTKRVKIVLQRNTSQNPSEYIKQIKSSPNVPYDPKNMPSKGLLKPNSIPSPINPFYEKKIGLKIMNSL